MILVALLIACGAAAATGILFQPGPWYQALEKPPFTPPDWLFPIAWTVIYLLAAGAGARLARRPGAGLAMALWAAQIALNTLWTPVFFGAHLIGTGLSVLALLWVVVAALTACAWRLDRVAGAMLLPYLLWLCLAFALNLAIWQANPPLPVPSPLPAG